MNARNSLIVISLVAAWCALWEQVSIANVISGLLVAVPVVVLAGSQTNGGTIRVIPTLRLIWLVVVDLVKSTVDVVWEILTPTDFTDETIIAIDTQAETRSHLLLLVVAITLTPGTAVVDTDPDTGRLYVHLLHADAEDEVTTHVRRLAALACAAFPGRTDESSTAASRTSSQGSPS